MTATAQSFYGDVLQNLRLWKASPPKLKKAPESSEEAAEVIAEKVGVEPADIADSLSLDDADVVSGQGDAVGQD